MLATNKSVKRTSGPRSGPSADSLLSIALRRVGSFALARPGTVALMLLFGGLGLAVSINALWMQSDRHPAPLFRQAALAPQHALALPKKAAESSELPPAAAPGTSPSASSSPAPQDAPTALPPSRATALAHGETGSAPQPKPPLMRHTDKDPLAGLIGESAPMPPGPMRQVASKPQLQAPHAPAPGRDAIAGLIEQSGKGR